MDALGGLMPKLSTDQKYLLSHRYKDSGQTTWYHYAPGQGSSWLHLPRDAQKPTAMSLERINEIISQTDNEGYADWYITDENNQTVLHSSGNDLYSAQENMTQNAVKPPKQIDPTKQYLVSATHPQRGTFWAYKSEQEYGWVQSPFQNQQPSYLDLSDIQAISEGDTIFKWYLTDSAKNSYPYQPEKANTEISENMTQTAAKPKHKFRVRLGKNQQADGDKPEQKEEEKEGWSPLLLVICIALFLLLGLAIVWNVQPFMDIVILLADRIDFTNFAQFLFALPGIGGLFQWIAVSFAAALGIMLYSIFQGLELAPFLYKRDPKRMRRIIEHWATWAKYRTVKKDGRAVSSMKRSYNNHPIRTYQTLCSTRNIVYILELAICFITHPPVTDGNLFTFLWYLVTFQIGKIEWINVALMFSVLFLVDRVVRIVLSLYPEIFPKKEEVPQA